MSDADRLRWDARYADRDPPEAGAVGLPAVFAPYAGEFPTAGDALEVACGQGGAAVWLAVRGLTVDAVDVSPVAIGRARDLAARSGVAGRCRFGVADLDRGLPPGGPFGVIVCHLYRQPPLYPMLAGRLAPGGLLAVAVLSEVGAAPGPYRAPAGELRAAFCGLDPVAGDESGGIAWLLARAPGSGAHRTGAHRIRAQ